jgi:hypothetical protein
MKGRDVGIAVSSVVFTPTIVAYCWIMGQYVLSGVILYAVAISAAYKMNLFTELRRWPMVSRISLSGGPVVLGFAYYYATQRPTYWMLAPAMLYTILVIIGGLALRGRFTY